ncbi:Transmembrane 4 superfamily [Carabus blaptoides fortunei]
MSLPKCSKVSYFLCNIFISFADVAVVALTSYIIYNLEQYKVFLPRIWLGPLALFIVLNIIQCFAFWKGFCAIVKENNTLILMLCASIIFNSIFDVFIALWTMLIRDNINADINKIMTNSFINYTKNQYKKEEWNMIQMQLQCCGIDGPISYSKYVDFVPIACCNTTTNGNSICEGGTFYKNSCLQALHSLTKEQLFYFILIVLLFVIIQILGIAVFCHLKAILSKCDKSTLSPSSPSERKALNKKSLDI